MAEIYNQLCALDQVRIRLNLGNLPRPNVTHPVQWVRQQAAALGYTTPRLVGFTSYHLGVHIGTTVPFDVNFTLTFPHQYVARELSRFAGATDRVVAHEASHPREWGTVLTGGFPGLQTELNSNIYTRAENPRQQQQIRQLTERSVRAIDRSFRMNLRNSANTLDVTDYPSLHADLARMGVPSNL